MLKNLFDTVIDNILRLIEKQIDDVKTGGSGVKVSRVHSTCY
jgi:hypothetical protein